LVWTSEKQISRVRVIRRADDYYAQFLVDWDGREEHELQGKMTGIDLGLKEFYTDSDGNTVDNPRYLRKSERRLKMLTRRVSKKHSSCGKKQSNRYHKAHRDHNAAKNILAKGFKIMSGRSQV
jgi:putative transposase